MKNCLLCLVLICICLFEVPLEADDLINSDVQYINKKKIVDLEVPKLEGEYYFDLIPHTLDIAEQAELAINIITTRVDPEYDYEFYYDSTLFRNPPIMWHDWSDWNASQWKCYEALSLLRLITGSTRNKHIDEIWLEVILRSIGPDGLFYIPLEGRPWSRHNIAWGPTVWRADGSTVDIRDESVHYIANPTPIGRIMGILTNYYLRDHKNPKWRILMDKMIDRSLEITIDKGDYGYIPLSFYEPDCKIDPNTPMPGGVAGIESYARLIQAPGCYYKITGYKPAEELSRKLINGILHNENHYTTEGYFCSKGMDDDDSESKGLAHFHAHTFALMSMVDYAVAAGDKELLEFTRKSFEWAKKQGNSTVGFFPEYISPNWEGCETCEVADMVAIALKLSEAEIGDYWDDADKWIRNQFIESQLTRIDWIYDITKDWDDAPENNSDTFEEEDIEYYGNLINNFYSTDRVLERSLGGFARNTTGNSWFNDGNNKVEGCCVGNGARTLYYIWENIMDYKNNNLKVNLLLNRASEWADLYSYLPYEGQINLKIKTACNTILIRIPDWVSQNSLEVECTVNNEYRKLKWDKRYINIGKGNPGDIIKIKFPIYERTVKEIIANKEYTLVIRGNTVISIDPESEECSLYQREYYKNKMPWKPVYRFASETIIDY